MNGFFVLVLAATVLGAAFFIPRLIAIDLVMAEMENLDDEELDAILAEFPDYMARRSL